MTGPAGGGQRGRAAAGGGERAGAAAAGGGERAGAAAAAGGERAGAAAAGGDERAGAAAAGGGERAGAAAAGGGERAGAAAAGGGERAGAAAAGGGERAGAAAGRTGVASEFEQLRPYLLRLAYSHLGSLAEAEDVVQEAWLRLERVDRTEIRDLRAWLTTTVARLSLGALTSARARRERYVGTWLPEPVVADGAGGEDPSDRITLDESVSMAMLVVLESLSPAERSAFLLHDVFGYSFEEVATIVGRTAAACRQLGSRARRRVEEQRPRYPASAQEQREIVEAFTTAVANGDIQALLGLLDPDVELRSDGGGLVPAARNVLRGSDRIVRALAGMVRHYVGAYEVVPVEVNGAAGLMLHTAEATSVVALTVDGGLIRSIDVIRNPEKLRHVRT